MIGVKHPHYWCLPAAPYVRRLRTLIINCISYIEFSLAEVSFITPYRIKLIGFSNFSTDIAYCIALEILPNFSIFVIIRYSPHALPLCANYKIIHLK